jgi:hypothetical protein
MEALERTDSACSLNHLMVAHWLEERALAEVEPGRKGKARSKGWMQSMGFTQGGKHYLHLEEALFLMHRGFLLLLLSVQQQVC